VPSDIKQLTADRPLTALRRVLDCTVTATAVRQGPAGTPGEVPGWLAFLCPAHSQALPRWPGTAADTEDTGSMFCGSVMDFRPTEQLLQSHADLWLTPLTGVDPKTFGAVWPEVLEQADRVLRARLEEGGEGELLNSIAMMLGMASEYAAEGDLRQATVPLTYCETMTQRL
jgi:hypothetical protein